MCGLAGIVHLGHGAEPDRELLASMTRSMTHRGPDDEGYYVTGNVGMGHRRLSIIDLAGGHQPIFNEDGTISIIFNGEIYNYQELMDALKRKGHEFSTRCDTETIVHLYEEFGLDCPQKLRGMYAFAIWDSNRKRLLLVRDRVGKKPMYYYAGEKVFVFASEIKALLESGMVPREVNVPAIDFFLSLGYVPGPETLFKGIRKLEPAQMLTLEEGGEIRLRHYWDFDAIPTVERSFPRAMSEFEDLLLESIRIRLMSEVPLGVFLSGGLDSTTIVALMTRMVDGPIKTFSLGYRDQDEANEMGFADLVAERFATEHHRFYLTADDLFESIDTLLQHTEEPITDSSAIALYKLAKLAKPEATVLLSGEGGDELFAGYPLYPRMRAMEKMSRLTRFLGDRAWTALTRPAGRNEKLEKYAEWLGQPFDKRFRSLSYDLVDATKNKMYRREFRSATRGKLEEYYAQLHSRCAGKTLLGRMLYIDTKTWLPGDLLTKADKMTMAASIELRAPFLDHVLIEFATSLPDEFKLKGKIGKYIVREYMKDKIPAEIISRKKKGWPVPLTPWFRDTLHARSREPLLSERSLGRGYFEPDYIAGLFERIKGGHDLGRRLFSLVVLELWHRKFMDGARTEEEPLGATRTS